MLRAGTLTLPGNEDARTLPSTVITEASLG